MAGTLLGFFLVFARSVRRRGIPFVAATLLPAATLAAPPSMGAAAAATAPCNVNPGAGPTWSPADDAAAADGHALAGSIAGMGAPTYYAGGYFGQEPSGHPVDVALIDTGVAPVPGLDSGNVVHGPDISFESQSSSLAH